MRKILSLTTMLGLAAAAAVLAAGTAVPATNNWPHWRGPSHNGVSAETGLAVSWGATCASDAPQTLATPDIVDTPDGASLASEQGRGRGGGGGGQQGRPLAPFECDDLKTENVAWKLSLPAYSGSTPIIWGDMIFLNVATAATTGELELWAIDRTTQAVKWKRPLADSNHMERKQNMSSPSPVTDGQHVWVMTGVGALKAFDFDGKEIWSRNIQDDYGRFGLNWGYASSPLLKDNALYVQVLHGMKTDDTPYVLKIDAATGKTIWQVERPTEAVRESPDSYTTPAWFAGSGREELIITGGDVVSGHNPETGAEYWRADVLNPQRDRNYRIVASPTIVGDLVIAPSRNNPLTAIRPGGSGDVAGSHVAWTFAQGPDVPTPVSDGKLLYVVRDGGVAFALDVATGETVYGPERLPRGTYSASPILADGKIYVTTEEEGVTTVYRAGPKFEVLASNRLADDCSPYCLSTVAISQGQLFIRTASFLWAIGERRQ
ncbi:MAG: PQQ-binding-like beta-propeller repeat protein [Acidobacteria bacterium]|nr:PQQ-binding-like beta-propeller repeat protein [Acidobacteriota bacterium]